MGSIEFELLDFFDAKLKKDMTKERDYCFVCITMSYDGVR